MKGGRPRVMGGESLVVIDYWWPTACDRWRHTGHPRLGEPRRFRGRRHGGIMKYISSRLRVAQSTHPAWLMMARPLSALPSTGQISHGAYSSSFFYH